MVRQWHDYFKIKWAKLNSKERYRLKNARNQTYIFKKIFLCFFVSDSTIRIRENGVRMEWSESKKKFTIRSRENQQLCDGLYTNDNIFVEIIVQTSKLRPLWK